MVKWGTNVNTRNGQRMKRDPKNGNRPIGTGIGPQELEMETWLYGLETDLHNGNTSIETETRHTQWNLTYRDWNRI